MKTKFYLGIVIVCAFVGFINASFLFEKAQSGDAIPCFVVSGCDQVQNSPYAHLFGVPLSFWGLLYYAVLICITIYLFLKERQGGFLSQSLRTFSTLWIGVVSFGFLFSLYLLYLQIFPIGAFCSSCLLSFVDMIIITASAMIVWHRIKQNSI
ncbi:MAG: vitamin K epoxide reductase family protein [Candidatus Paceibacterota bacterium]